MRLQSAFIKLPFRFDVDRLAKEVLQFTELDWVGHPNGFTGNSSVRLISAHGGENDWLSGPMCPTPHLQRCPYLQQVLASFSSVFGRSRLMGLAPHSEVPAHRDLNHNWRYHVRIHIPVFTWPDVTFHCDEKAVHMGRGEAWIFDNWRLHSVKNPTEHFRIHLVADTSGSAEFWRLVRRGYDPFDSNSHEQAPTFIEYRPDQMTTVLQTETYNQVSVLPPSEVEVLIASLLEDVRAAPGNDASATASLCQAAEEFSRDWRQTWYLYGESEEGWPRYDALRRDLSAAVQARELVLASNGAQVAEALHLCLLVPALGIPLKLDAGPCKRVRV
jgi:hypothetical protein